MEHEQSFTNVKPFFDASMINHRSFPVIRYDYDQALATSSNSTIRPFSEEQKCKKYDKS
jgi:hypothetical protein